jgi:hypothetical protein
MTIAKEQLVEILRSRGDHDLADRVSRELPAVVDPADHPDLLRGLGPIVGDAERHGRSTASGADGATPEDGAPTGVAGAPAMPGHQGGPGPSAAREVARGKPSAAEDVDQVAGHSEGAEPHAGTDT